MEHGIDWQSFIGLCMGNNIITARYSGIKACIHQMGVLQQSLRSTGCKEYEDASKSFRTGCLEQEEQMLQLSATRYSCVAIL
jgi:hypothetical protein